ncbi:hypothetical protein TSAR_012086 [Trichomalopsis sarcophagae]|uniref:Uncharacterized protein n=1 Tax=Trichomalopsis sarcophagae TaxID=543379 RepID=A0A232EVX3_9HYME|nr:hypothetical protein TSAR_012086 [Trichomalopsis sarcophagae]
MIIINTKKECLPVGLIPPKVFKYLDENNYLINNHQTPIIYHIPRNIHNKSIQYTPDRIHNVHLVYNYSITELDKKELQDFDYYSQKCNQ